MSGRRALHFVFKIGDRNQTIKFYKDVLGMKVLVDTKNGDINSDGLILCNNYFLHSLHSCPYVHRFLDTRNLKKDAKLLAMGKVLFHYIPLLIKTSLHNSFYDADHMMVNGVRLWLDMDLKTTTLSLNCNLSLFNLSNFYTWNH